MARKNKANRSESLLCVRSFMDVDPPEEEIDTFGEALLFAESMSLKKKKKKKHKYLKAKTRVSYRKYTPEQIEKLFYLVIEENYTAKDAALLTGINVRTAQNYIKTYNNDIQRRLPGTYNKPRGRPRSKLTDEHSKFLLDHIEKNPTATLNELKVKVCEEFEGLKSQSRLYIGIW